MDNCTTFETSVKLEEKGFAQPDFKFGQLWYETESQDFAIVGTAKFELFKQHRNGALIYAPTPCNILKERPGLKLEFTGTEWMVRMPGTFTSGVDDNGFDFDSYMPGVILAKHENPAEACALAYLGK